MYIGICKRGAGDLWKRGRKTCWREDDGKFRLLLSSFIAIKVGYVSRATLNFGSNLGVAISKLLFVTVLSFQTILLLISWSPS